MPLFSQAKVGKKLAVLPNCNVCQAWKTCTHPKQTWAGGRARVVVVVDGPAHDRPDGMQHTSPEGLKTLCSRVGIDIGSFAVLPASACYGASEGAWKHCQPLLATNLQKLAPEVIIPFGSVATQAVVGRFYQHSSELPEKWYGQRIPDRTLNAWICPVGFASLGLRNYNATNTWAYRWFKEATSLRGRPWTPESKIRLDPMVETPAVPDVCRALQRASNAKWAAFDYETTCIKPETPGAAIVTMSVAWVEEGRVMCVAFPLSPAVVPAVRQFLTSPVLKIAANMKFEDRFSRRILGVEVSRWAWDTMLVAHIEDPQPEITGLKFQAYARLGIPYFADEIEPYFENDGSLPTNRIYQAPLGPLLLYNGIDSIAELLLASIQMKEAGMQPDHIVPKEYLPC